MRFQFPQFIETKTKLVGPFTFGQFGFLLVGGVIIFIIRFIVPLYLLWPLGIGIAGMSIALGFATIDGIPLPRYIVSALKFMMGKKKYVFHANEDKYTTTP